MRLALPVAALVAALLSLLWGTELWNDSDGQYLRSGLQLADGAALYDDVAAAQPPGMYVLVAAAATVHDGWESARVLFVALQGLTAVLVALLALRLGAPRWTAPVAAAAALLTPWALHEHGAVLPEVAATPALLGAVLLGKRPAAAGVLLAVAVGIKLPMLLPALGVLVAVRDRRGVLLGLGAGLLVQAVVFGLWFGPADLWRGTVEAQGQIGLKGAGDAVAYAAQAGWSLLGLLLLAAVGSRGLLGRGEQERALAGATAGAALTLFSLVKLGTLPVVVIPLEALLLPPAVLALRRPVQPAAALGAALLVLAAGALLLSPDAPRGFTWPGGGTNWARVASQPEVDRLRAAARACPPGTAWPGSVWIAVLAGRRVPGEQSDPFITQAPAYAAQAARRASDRLCDA